MTEDEKAKINRKIDALQSSLESVQNDISALQSETYVIVNFLIL